MLWQRALRFALWLVVCFCLVAARAEAQASSAFPAREPSALDSEISAAPARTPAAPAQLDCAELFGGKVCVTRSEAPECPSAAVIAARVLELGTTAVKLPLWVEVEMGRTPGGALRARLRSTGFKAGERELAITSGECATLLDAVSLSLSVLLNLVPASKPAANRGTANTTVPAPEEPTLPAHPEAHQASEQRARDATDRSHEARRAPPLHGFLAAGLGLGSSVLDTPLSAVGSLRAGLLRGRAELGLEVFMLSKQTTAVDPGTIQVNLWGGAAMGCALFSLSRRVAWSPCVGLSLGRLGADAERLVASRATVRPYWAIRAGAAARFRVSRFGQFELRALLVAPLSHDSFSVGGHGEAYRTPSWGGILEAGPKLLIW
ncbi:MAG TPA: hypothetical protein VFQ61_12360 [Polyangiaceae bacterium]|nr:hypothetical protein [Polyangiaceae bacterium]